MQKFQVHTYQAYRVTYEVEAESAEAAMYLVGKSGKEMNPITVNNEDPEWLQEVVIDPMLPDGEVDYENVVNTEFPPDLL